MKIKGFSILYCLKVESFVLFFKSQIISKEPSSSSILFISTPYFGISFQFYSNLFNYKLEIECNENNKTQFYFTTNASQHKTNKNTRIIKATTVKRCFRGDCKIKKMEKKNHCVAGFEL